MHPNAVLINKLYSALDQKDAEIMASCYHDEATFRDIAFSLNGKSDIRCMWKMIAKTDLRARFKVLHADDQSASAELIDTYTFSDNGNPVRNEIQSSFKFRDGLIIEHIDSCSRFNWARQALGLFKGTLVTIAPFLLKKSANEKLARFKKETGC